jgi:hypothetical protein
MARPAPKPRHTVQRMWEPTDGQCIGLLGILVALFFAHFLTGKAFLWEDFVYQWYPFRQFAASTLARGEIPLWNPYNFNGMPFLAEIQTEVFYLPMTILTLFVRDGRLDVFWLQLANILHYWLAAAGMFLLSRSYGLRRIPSLFAGIAFGFSGFLVLHAIHQVILVVVAWFPLITWMFRRTLGSRSWLWVFGTGIVLGHSFFGGSPQMSLFFYFFLLCFVVFEVITGHGMRGLLRRPALVAFVKSAVIVAVSFGIAMVQFLPTQEMSALSARAQITFEKATEGSLGWSQLITLLTPKFFGSSSAHGANYWGPGPYWHYWETCIYVGVLPLLLLVFAIWVLRSNRTILFLAGFALFALLYSFGGNFVLFPAFFHGVPGFSSFRNPARMGVFVAFAASLASAFVLHHLGEEHATRNAARHRRALFTVTGGAAVLLVVGLGGTFDGILGTPPPATVLPQMHKALGTSLALLAAGGAILWLMISRKAAMNWLGLFACTLLFIDVYVFSANHNTSPDNPADHFRYAERITKFIKQQEGIFRVNIRNPQGLMMDRNQGMVDQIFTMEGYTPLVLRRVHPPTDNPSTMFDLLNVRFITVTDSVNRQLVLEERPQVLARAHMVYNTRTMHSEEELLAALKESAFNPATVALVEGELPHQFATPTTESPAWKADITEFLHNRIRISVSTDRDGLLVLSETHYPGWNAYVDGNSTPVYRTDFNLRGIVVPAGSHGVEFRFESNSFRLGLWITLATLALCIVGGAVSWRRSRNSNTSPDAP